MLTSDENGAKKEGDRMKNTDQGDATGNADDSMSHIIYRIIKNTVSFFI